VTDAGTIRTALSWCEESGQGERQHKQGIAALDRLVADRDAWIKAAADNGAAQDAAEKERDEARAERDHWSESALADRTLTAEAELEVEKKRLREMQPIMRLSDDLHAAEAEVHRLNHENGALEAETRTLREIIRPDVLAAYDRLASMPGVNPDGTVSTSSMADTLDAAEKERDRLEADAEKMYAVLRDSLSVSSARVTELEAVLLEISEKKCLNGNSTCDWPCVVCRARAALAKEDAP
jgi:hypothetical protein